MKNQKKKRDMTNFVTFAVLFATAIATLLYAFFKDPTPVPFFMALFLFIISAIFLIVGVLKKTDTETKKYDSFDDKIVTTNQPENTKNLSPEELVQNSGYYENSGCAGRTFFMAGAIGLGAQFIVWVASGARSAFSWKVLAAGLILMLVGYIKAEKDGSMRKKQNDKEKEDPAIQEIVSRVENRAVSSEKGAEKLVPKRVPVVAAPLEREKPKQKNEKGERYKKFKEWVDESFVNKTIFVLAIVAILVVILVLIPKGIKLIEKMQLIKSQTVYYSTGGTRYHLYDDCSNMSDPHVTFERKAKEYGLERCSKCYAGVMNYYGYYYWNSDEWTFFALGVSFSLILLFAILLKKSKALQSKIKSESNSSGLFITSVILLIFIAITIFALALEWGYI